MGGPGGPFSAIHPMSPAALYSADFSNPMFAQSGLLNAIVASATVPRPPNGMAGPGEFANGGFGGQGNVVHPVQRCLYIGNLPEDTTTTDICEAVRGGLLLSVKYIADKHYAVSRQVITPSPAADLFPVRDVCGPDPGDPFLPPGNQLRPHDQAEKSQSQLGKGKQLCPSFTDECRHDGRSDADRLHWRDR